MNKNPFIPPPSYTPQQPPLPPGPPPPQPAQPDYSAYWAAAAQQPQHVQPPIVGPYNTQWNPPQAAPRPPVEQSALYANYGYGGQHGTLWQQQQRHNLQQSQQHFHHQPPPPVVQPPPPPPPQPAYNPYQPTAGYPQPYVPQAAPPPIPVQPVYHPPPPQAPQQHFIPQHLHQQPPQQQPRHNHNIHHTPPQHLPPAKRQRFDGPSHGQQLQHRPLQQFQPPPPLPPSGTYGPGSGQGHGRGGQPGSQTSIGGVGRGSSRGNMGSGGRGGRAGSMSGGRPMGGRGGRGGYFGGGGGGGGGRGGGSNALRGHGSRGNFGNNKDYHGRRGGSFNNGGGGLYSHQSMGSFRGRGPGHSSGRGGRHDGGQSGFLSRDGSMSTRFTSPGKRDENRRTLTDFKIVGLEIRDLGWTWGILPQQTPVKAEVKKETPDVPELAVVTVKKEVAEEEVPSVPKVEGDEERDSTEKGESDDGVESKPVPEFATLDTSVKPSSISTPPPSRIRIYFHTPVTADDSHPILHASSFRHDTMPSDSRKGKRKKLEDDDGDLEEGRGRPPPPQMGSTMSDDRSSVAASVAPSIADTAVSEGDWLMAAIVEDEGEQDADADGEDDKDDQLGVSQVMDIHHPGEMSGANGAAKTDINGYHHAERDMGGDGHDVAGTAHTETRVDECDHESSVKTDRPQDAPAESEERVVSVVPDGNDAADTSEVSSAEVIAEVNGADARTNVPGVVPKQTELASTVPDGEHTVPLAPEISQNDEHVDVSISSTVAAEPAPPVSVSVSDTFSIFDSVPHPDLFINSEEQSADCIGNPDMQVPDVHPTCKPLEAHSSLASTVLEFDPQETAALSDDGVATVNGDEDSSIQDKLPAGDEPEHISEPPRSPTPNNVPSLVNGESSNPAAKDAKTPSANRLSISYAGGNKRLVINAEAVETLKVFRHEGRIEVSVMIDKAGEDGLKGILIEGLSDTTKSYLPLQILSSAFEHDPTLPPFSKVAIPSTVLVIVHLDTQRPLSEPKWAKSGDIQDWLKSMFGRMFWVAGDAADGWEKKITVVDPDPPPTIWTVLEGWAGNSPVADADVRQSFLKTHMANTDNILEILLRLVRGERATPFSQSSPALTAPSVSGPLLSALSRDSAHGSQQTHVSLAVLALFRMSMEYAKKAHGEKGKQEVEERVGEIIRCLPSHLIYKSLDGIFKEWRVEKKGR